MTRSRLFTPGPTEVPAEVREAFASFSIHHRSDEFQEILEVVRRKVLWLAGCSGETVLFASSGSGGMEAAVSPLFSAGEEVIVVRSGKFGERWVDLTRHYQLQTKVIDVDWGKAVSVESISQALTPHTKGILLQGCESSTGVKHPIAEIGKLISSRDDILFVVDGIMTLGIEDVHMERDRIDLLVGASQKGLMSPPGLALVVLNQRALARMKNPGGSYYFSVARELTSLREKRTGFTPAISHVCALAAALSRIEAEGKPKLFARHKALQKRARSTLQEMGFALLARAEEASCGVTTVIRPEGMNLNRWLCVLKEREGLIVAGGHERLKGKIFRLAHFGACQMDDLRWALEVIRKYLPGNM